MDPGDRRDVEEWLYLIMVVALAVYFVIGGIAWVVLLFQGRDVPAAFATVLASVGGGLVGTLGSRLRSGGGPDRGGGDAGRD